MLEHETNAPLAYRKSVGDPTLGLRFVRHPSPNRPVVPEERSDG